MRVLIAALFLLNSVCAHSQTLEPIAIQILVPGGTPCMPAGASNTPSDDGRVSGNQVIFPENWTDGVLPDPAQIVWSQVWVDGVDPIQTERGNIPFLVDPGQVWSKLADYPIHQRYQVKNLNNIGTLQLQPHGNQFVDNSFSPPVVYHSGDGIVVAPECNNALTTTTRFATYFTVKIIGVRNPVTGTFTSPNAPLLSVTAATPVGGQSPYHLRMLVPAPSFHATKIRARVRSNYAQIAPTIITHIGVGLQSSNQDMQAAPVEMTFNTQTGTSVSPANWAWTDWTPFDMPSGLPVIIGVSLWTSGNNNAWTLTASPNGNGMWFSGTDDSWNSATMAGPSVFQPSRTDVIDMVQVQ